MTSTTALLVTSTFYTNSGCRRIDEVVNRYKYMNEAMHACYRLISGLSCVPSTELFWFGRLDAAILTYMGVWLHNQCSAKV